MMRRDRLQALAPYARRLPLACNLLLILLIAASLARIGWLLYPLPQSRFELPVPTALPARSGQLPKVNVEQIAAANLFGLRQSTGTTAPVDAPETALNLKLKGILAFGSETASRALIADGSGKEKPYAVGDDVPGGAILKAIHADRVILERSGRFETLRLERNKSGGSAAASFTPPAATPAAAAGSTGGEATTLAELRNELLREPGRPRSTCGCSRSIPTASCRATACIPAPTAPCSSRWACGPGKWSPASMAYNWTTPPRRCSCWVT
jgi:general secretion pathway protein C